jgi:hypothetical protein
MQGYNHNQYNQTAPVPALDAPAQPEGRKKSSIGRDVAIGVAIAAVVLGGFLAVKFLVLDGDDSPSGDTTTTSNIATLKVELKPPVDAELFLDGSKTAEHVVTNGASLPINAGKRKVRIVAKDGQVCESEIELKAGETKVVSCELNTKTADAGSGSGSDAKPAAGSGSDAKPAAGSGSDAKAGSGSDAKLEKPEPGKGSDAKPVGAGSATAVAVKPPDEKKPPEVAVKPPVEKKPDVVVKPPVEKKPDVVVKPPVEKKPDVVVVKKPDTKKPPDKMPPEDNPADRAGMVQDGYVVVSSNPKAKIAVDGTETGLTTPTKLKLSPGKHKIGFSYGTTKSAFPVTVKAGETINFHKDLE